MPIANTGCQYQSLSHKPFNDEPFYIEKQSEPPVFKQSHLSEERNGKDVHGAQNRGIPFQVHKYNLSVETSNDSLKRCDRKTKNKKLLKKRRRKLFKNHACSWAVSPPSSYSRTTKKVKLNRSFRCRKSVEKLRRRVKAAARLSPERKVDYPKKGKRGWIGGKAKGKPPQEERYDKSESEEDAENVYFHRISLGQFQQWSSNNGEASTSNPPEVEYWLKTTLPDNEDEQVLKEINHDDDEELELLELQEWGQSSDVIVFEVKDQNHLKLQSRNSQSSNEFQPEENAGNINRYSTTNKILIN